MLVCKYQECSCNPQCPIYNLLDKPGLLFSNYKFQKVELCWHQLKTFETQGLFLSFHIIILIYRWALKKLMVVAHLGITLTLNAGIKDQEKSLLQMKFCMLIWGRKSFTEDIVPRLITHVYITCSS